MEGGEKRSEKGYKGERNEEFECVYKIIWSVWGELSTGAVQQTKGVGDLKWLEHPFST